MMAVTPASVPPPSQETPPVESIDGTGEWRIFVAVTVPHFGNEETATKAVGNILADLRNVHHQPGISLEDWWLIPVGKVNDAQDQQACS